MIAFPLLCRAMGLPEPVSEHVFAAPRRFRFDFAWIDHKLALEVQGGLFKKGRHVNGAALLKEHEKLNIAATLGWRVMYCQPKDITNGSALSWVEQAMGKEPKL